MATKDPKAVARALAAKKAKAKKRAAIKVKMGDMVKCRKDMPFRTAFLTRLDPDKTYTSKFAGMAGEVVGINAQDKEVRVKMSNGIHWFHDVDLELDDDPIMSDDTDTEFFDDEEFEEEFEEE